MNEIVVTQQNEQNIHRSLTQKEYQDIYEKSISDPDLFWSKMADTLDWYKKPTIIKNASFTGNVSIKWYEDGVLNACYNCLDRHLKTRGDETAFIFEGNSPDESEHISYKEATQKVSQLANVLKSRGVKKGDRVMIYMPMIVEACYAMLACARIGAIHSVVFGGFSADALADRIIDCGANLVITADEGFRGNKIIPLKKSVDLALTSCPNVSSVITFKRSGGGVFMQEGRDLWWHESVDVASEECPCEEMNAEDPLFILYTSGSTGKPKGVLHTTGGYLVYAATTHNYSFDYKQGEVYWCTADVGWITGHSYIVYGPLLNGATSLVFEGVPNYPDASRFWQVVEKHKVAIFYTAPTAIRALMRSGDDFVKCTDLSSLRLLGTVGEPINAEAWQWYRDVVGNGETPIVDTYWQTETGGHIITPLPGFDNLKAGSASRPFFGIKPVLLDNEGKELQGTAEGSLCIKDSWPGQMRTIFGDHERFIKTYFSTYNGYYFTSDGARRDEDGEYWITGRVDDVLNVSGHRLGTAEIESAIGKYEAVAESAVVGINHEVKGQAVYAFVVLKANYVGDDTIKNQIKTIVRNVIGAIATPDVIQISPDLPKTRSGKIMRRILRKIAAGETDNLGDTSTLSDPTIVSKLIANRD